MDRRKFLRSGGKFLIASTISMVTMPGDHVARMLVAAEGLDSDPNPNLADRHYKAVAKASTYVDDPPWGYDPGNVMGTNVHLGWEAMHQTSGAWLEIKWTEEHPIGEIWILPRPLPYDVVGQAPYMMTYSRSKLLEPPREVECSVSGGRPVTRELPQSNDYQIIPFPRPTKSDEVRVTVKDIWAKPGGQETGLGKVRVFQRRHERGFEIDVYSMYDVHDGKPVQSATLHLINPGSEIRGARLTVSHQAGVLAEIPLAPIPGRAGSHQDIWIPSPFTDDTLTFRISAGDSEMGRVRVLRVPAYQTYFKGGVFALNCTCHNDLGWLNTQKKTADYRSKEIILPAMKLLAKYPEFRYSMESTAYLMEFLERHPEKRDEMAKYMEENRFVWGGSYVQCLEGHVGPEKLARQFYFGKRWLEQTFPGVHTYYYVKTDPPEMIYQMPQIVKRAGLKYIIQGRMPFGFYNWESPDGTDTLTYAYHYAAPMQLLDPKGNQGWLHYARERAPYYSSHNLPPMFSYDYTSDYLPPQPALPPYAREENEAMKRFAAVWNEHFADQPEKQIHPPRMEFVQHESFLDQFTENPLDITELRGEWPLNWAYYDEPGHRKGLLWGREAHNELLAAERLLSGLGQSEGFGSYPEATFTEAWKANCWPDHGWGGNRGIVTDSVYVASYEKSKRLAEQLLAESGSKVAKKVKRSSSKQIPLVVFNPVSWPRTDLVEFDFTLPQGWTGLTIRDGVGKEVPYERTSRAGENHGKIALIASDVPSIGYRTFCLEPGPSFGSRGTPLRGDKAENEFFSLTLGPGGIKGLFDKRKKWDVLRTEKFCAGEVLQFTAPGVAWEGPENVTMQDFDKTSNHAFPIKSFVRGAIRSSALREARFQHFTLREWVHLYHELDRVDMEIEVLNWDGTKGRELRVAFPINLEGSYRSSYETQFGTIEMGKDELDFSLLPPDEYTAFNAPIYGGDHPLAFREAINWIDASDQRYLGVGCLAASDMTVHLFRDETPQPVAYPVLQHVLLSTRKSLAWNPVEWLTQKGSYRYRMSLMPHAGDWRLRYREAIGFNYRLAAFLGSAARLDNEGALPESAEFLKLEPTNLVLTAMKKAEGNDNRIVLRFYEAEGSETTARIQLSRHIRKAWRASLIEYDGGPIQPLADGTLEFPVKPWEIVTIKVEV